MSLGRTLGGGLADFVLVLLFVVIGRANHGEAVSVAGVAHTAWPFLAGAAVGWALVLLARASAAAGTQLGVVGRGAVVWLCCVGVGMALRVATGTGTEADFVIVALAVLGAFLLGWRAVALAVRRLRTRR